MVPAMIVACLLVAGCGNSDADQPERTPATAGTSALPVPEGARGGAVTGMPGQPGPGAIGPPDPAPAGLMSDAEFDQDGNAAAAAEADQAVLGDGSMLASDAENPQQSRPSPADEPGPPDAVAVVRAYHAALDSGDFARAYRFWSDGGATTGQSPQQFAQGFAETSALSVEVLPPGRIGAAAGSRYIEVPVAIEETLRDGSVRRQVGAYTLRRAVVDGATTEQRAWRIASADLREVRP